MWNLREYREYYVVIKLHSWLDGSEMLEHSETGIFALLGRTSHFSWNIWKEHEIYVRELLTWQVFMFGESLVQPHLS